MRFLMVLLFPLLVLADNAASYKDGKKLGADLIQGPAALDTKTVPDYQGENVPEKHYQDNYHEMSEKATAMTHDPENGAGTSVMDSQQTRSESDFRVTKDDRLIKESNEINSNPLRYIGGEAERETGGVRKVVETTHQCEESAEEATYTCEETRIVHPTETTKIVPQTYFLNFTLPQRYFGEGSHKVMPTALGVYRFDEGYVTSRETHNDIQKKTLLPFNKRLIPHMTFVGKRPVVTPKVSGNEISLQFSVSKGGRLEFWYFDVLCPALLDIPANSALSKEYNKTKTIFRDNPPADTIGQSCQELERQSDKGLCRYGDVKIIEGPGTRKICKGDDCISLTRDWWKRRRTYHCKYPSKDNCDSLRSAGCDQIKATCKTRIENVCVENIKTFLCRSERLGNGITRIGGDVPFCLDGNCDDRSWAANKDFADAMSKMSLFKEMSKDMDAKNATVFRGIGMKCSKATINFQDCCGNGGWGKSMGLGGGCKQEEQDLQKEREAKKCVFVGTYCAEKDPIFKICLRKKSSFCCFGTKLAKLVHEQGRSQLGIGWGDAEHPDCRPFSITELQRIDFSQIDFSSLFSEVRAKTNVANVSTAAEGLGTNWQDKLGAAKLKDDEKIKASDLYEKQGKNDASL